MDRSFPLALVLSWVCCSALAPSVAAAQYADDGDDGGALSDLPPEDIVVTDSFSVRGGRTLGGGQMALVAGAGWPGVFAELVIGASDTFNLGPRVDFHYNSPLMGFRVGVGAEVSLPLRIHIWSDAQNALDISLHGRPFFLIGRGALVGGRGTFNDDLGFGFGAAIGARLGWLATERLNVFGGIDTTFAYVTVPDASNGQFVGTFAVVGGVEWSLQRDILLFAELTLGGGFADDFSFNGRTTFKFYGGAAFLF